MDNTHSADSAPIQIPYKYLKDSSPVLLDVYLPRPAHPQVSQESPARPVLVYFHGGGLTVGNRTSWFPHWLKARAISAGWIFVSADYRLMPPATGHDIVQDIKGLFTFVACDLRDMIQTSSPPPTIDSEEIFVAGTSAGGLCAYLAGVHAVPRPKAILSMYGQGGDLLTFQYLAPKTKPFVRGRELLDPAHFPFFLHPGSGMLTHTSDSALAYHGSDYHIPGYPANPRMLLSRLYLQLGVFLDYYTGLHEPSVSEALREILFVAYENSEEGSQEELVVDHIEARAILSTRGATKTTLSLFPQFSISPAFPPTFFLHGSKDSAVPITESQHLCSLLKRNGVEAELELVDGEEHSFDYQEGAEAKFRDAFDRAWGFLVARSGFGKTAARRDAKA